MLKKILGFAPKLESDGSYSPSKMALKMGVSDTTDFENISYQKYNGEKSKVLVIFTEEKNLKMKNGKFFSTGNHPVEALLPMLHLKNAGFEFRQPGCSACLAMNEDKIPKEKYCRYFRHDH